jgi:hypothetical protein
MSLMPLYVLGVVDVDLNGHPDKVKLDGKPGYLAHSDEKAPKEWFAESVSTLDFMRKGKSLIRYEDAGQLLSVIPGKSLHPILSPLTAALELPQSELVAERVAYVQYGPTQTFGAISRTSYLMVFDESGPKTLVEKINAARAPAPKVA